MDGQGFNAEWTKTWDNGLDIQVSYTYLAVEDAGGERLAGSPRTLLKGRLGIPLYRDWEAGLELRYRGDVKTHQDPSISVDGFTQANLTLSGSLLKNLSLSASVYNLLDTEYIYPLGNYARVDRYIYDDLSFRVKLTYGF